MIFPVAESRASWPVESRVAIPPGFRVAALA
jgi:hypothetical protein